MVLFKSGKMTAPLPPPCPAPHHSRRPPSSTRTVPFSDQPAARMKRHEPLGASLQTRVCHLRATPENGRRNVCQSLSAPIPQHHARNTYERLDMSLTYGKNDFNLSPSLQVGRPRPPRRSSLFSLCLARSGAGGVEFNWTARFQPGGS